MNSGNGRIAAVSQARSEYHARMARGIASHVRRLQASKLIVRPLTRVEERSAIEAFVASKGLRRVVLGSDGSVDLIVVRPPLQAPPKANPAAESAKVLTIDHPSAV